MSNLFSIFDPNVTWLNVSLNWISVILVIFWLPVSFWLVKPKTSFLLTSLMKTLSKEFSLNFGSMNSPGHTHWAISLFLMILLNNLGGMTSYTFTASSHLSFTVALALVMWVSYFTYSLVLNVGEFLAHLVPVGTPYILMPFMVLIELVSNLIRPLTLSVRLAANLVAGHLLMTLVSTPLTSSTGGLMLVIMSGLMMLLMLELAVAFIQAYVFSMLSTLYLSEVNSSKFNYLCNF